MSVDLHRGDCRQVLKSWSPASVDLICTDPPYQETALEWDIWPTGWLDAAARVIKPTGSMWCFGSLRMFLDRYHEFTGAGWKLAQEIIWEKHNGSGLLNDRFRRVHEIAVQFYRADSAWGDVYKAPQFTHDAKARVVRKSSQPQHLHGATGATVYRSEEGGPRLMRSVIYARSEHSRAVHPTQKPVSLLLPLISYGCPPAGHVLDPFAGSGSTALACRILNLRCSVIEARDEYCAAIEERLSGDAPLFGGAV